MTRLQSVVSIIILIILTTPAQVSAAPPQQSPAIEGIVNLGVPAGNGTSPSHLTINRQTGQLYILSHGIPALKQGNGLSVYDITSGQITNHIKINQGDNQTLDLQFDPDSGLIYALWREQLGTDTPPTLTVINSNSLQATQNISGIESFTAGGGKLYAAHSDQLTAYEASGNTVAERQHVELPQATAGPMAVDLNANRLYIARNANGFWDVNIFEADTLQPVSNYPTNGVIKNILPLPGANQVFIVTEQAGVRVLERITADGEMADLPSEMGPQQFNADGMALSPDGAALYFSNGQPPLSNAADAGATGPAITGISTDDLLPLAEIPLLTNVVDLVVGDDQAFGLNPFSNFLYVIDLTTNEANIVKTAIEIKDVLVDPDGNQLYVSDSASRIRRLEADTLAVLAETQLPGPDFGYQSAAWAGELTLDKKRNRLYISGRPATVLEADTLTEVAMLGPGGQLSPDPTGENIYVSDCGLSIVDAPTLSTSRLVPGTDAQPLGLSPNPCVAYSQLDPQNQLLYSLTFNGTPGSNSGQYLYVYDVTLEPTLIFSDTEISFIQAKPDPTNRRAFTTWLRHSNQRLRSLSVAADGSAQYEQQLMGVTGEPSYSPGTNQLYLTNADRLLTLDADTLTVLDELYLPANYDYRLADLNPVDDRLYLIGLDGNLLIAGLEGTQFSLTTPPPPTHPPTGDILELHPTASGDILARIDSNYDNTFDTRLYLTSDEGQSWQDLSQHLPPFVAQAAAANDNTLFAGLTDLGYTGGLYSSIDGGQSWSAVMAGLRELWFDRIYLSPNFEQDRLALVNTVHAGLHYSTDGGQSWTPLVELDANATFPAELQAAAVAFDGQGTVLVSQSLEQMRGIFKTTQKFDGTLSAWEQLFDRPVDLLVASPDGQLVLAFGQGLWRSTDGGQSWLAAGAGLTGLENHSANGLLFSPNFAADQTVYLFFTDAVSGDLPARLFRSTDGGQQWQLWAAPLDDNNFTAIALTPDGDLIFGDSNSQLTRLAPNTIAWADPNEITTRFPFDDISASPAFNIDQTIFAFSNEHGLFKSTDGGQSWQLADFPARAYRPSVTRYQIAISPNYDQDQMLFVATGRSLHRSVDGGQNWEQLTPEAQQSFAAQKIALSPDFAANAILLVSTADTLYRSSDGGDSWQQVLAADEASAADILAFAPDGSTAYARFGYTNSLHLSTDGGQNWLPQTSSFGEYFTMLDTATAPDNSLIGVMDFEGRVLQADPQSQPWRDFSATLPPELTAVQTVAYGPSNAVFIGGQGGVYRSEDNGQSWQAVTTGLPADANLTTLRATATHLFAALANGAIYASADSGNSWQDISVVR